MNSKEFADYVVHDVLVGISGITARAMFGGHGLYKNGLIFGILVSGEIYFKVDDALQKKYEALGSKPFTYDRHGKLCAMKYWVVPASILADREQLAEWVSWSCLLSAAKKTKAKKL